jgi:hypothetical protein
MNKYPACQECSRADAGQCQECVTIGYDPGETPSDKIMTAIRNEVAAAIAAAKLEGYRQAQREELNFFVLINDLFTDKTVERIRYLHKEIGL